MKTIFITSFHGLIPRNILFTPVLRNLLSSEEVRVVLIVPKPKVQFFETHFGHSRLVIEGVAVGGETRSLKERLFARLAHAMGDTPSLRILYRGRLKNHGRVRQYYLWYVPLRVIGRFHLVRWLLRSLDFRLARGDRFQFLFDRYRPDLVFATDVLDKYEIELMHLARRRGVLVAAMVRSWDNLTKFGLVRAVPDRLLVWNENVRGEAVGCQSIPSERISVVGISHYDAYLAGPAQSRRDFLTSFGQDFQKPVILFAPTGSPRLYAKKSDRFHIELLAASRATVIVRMPPTNPVDLEGFAERPNVIFDKPGVEFNRWPTVIDSILTPDDDRRFIAELAYADVVVCGPTSVAADAAVMDRPTILVNFTPSGEPYLDDAEESYNSIHMQYVIQSGAARIANSPEELTDFIRRYFENPKLDEEGRKRFRETFLWRSDGRASQRVANCLLEMLFEKR